MNITFTENKDVIKAILMPERKLVPIIGKLLDSKNHKIVELALYILANLITTDEVLFELVFSTGVLDCILTLVDGDVLSRSLGRTITWANSNFAKCPTKSEGFIETVLKIISWGFEIADEETNLNSVYALKHLTDVEEDEKCLERRKMVMIHEA